jgi:hypothetical protein
MSSLSLLSILVAVFFVVSVLSSNENDIVRIINSGSTNTAGYRIELQRNGIVKWTVSHRRPALSPTPSTPNSSIGEMSIRLSTALTNSVFQAVQQASPLNQFPQIHCGKSVSFGTTLYVTFNGQQSPDLTCPTEDAHLIAVNNAVHEVISILQINTRG